MEARGAQRDGRPSKRSAAPFVHPRSKCSIHERKRSWGLSIAERSPEAFFEAFANIYCATYDAIIAVTQGESIERINTVYPNVHDGV